MSGLFLLFESLLNLLSQSIELVFLFTAELAHKVFHLSTFCVIPFLKFSFFQSLNLSLNFMRFDVFLLLGQIFLYFSQINDFSSFSSALAQGSLDFLLKLYEFFFMAINRLSFHPFALCVVLKQLFIPVFVELSNFL